MIRLTQKIIIPMAEKGKGNHVEHGEGCSCAGCQATSNYKKAQAASKRGDKDEADYRQTIGDYWLRRHCKDQRS